MRKTAPLLAVLILIAAAPKPKPKASPGTVARALYAGVLEKGKKLSDERMIGRLAGTVAVPIRATPRSVCRITIYNAHPAFNVLRHERGVKVPEELQDRDCRGTVESVTIVHPENAEPLTQEELDGIFLALALQLLD